MACPWCGVDESSFGSALEHVESVIAVCGRYLGLEGDLTPEGLCLDCQCSVLRFHRMCLYVSARLTAETGDGS